MGKRLFTAAVVLLLTLPILSQNLVSSVMDNVDQNAKKGITQINISGKMLRFAAKSDPGIDKEMGELLNSIDKISMVAGLSFNDKTQKLIEKSLAPYEELLTVVEEEQTIRMYTRESKNRIEEFVLCVASGEGVILMSITGKIDLQLIARLSESINIEGVEYLDKVNKAGDKKDKKKKDK